MLHRQASFARGYGAPRDADATTHRHELMWHEPLACELSIGEDADAPPRRFWHRDMWFAQINWLKRWRGKTSVLVLSEASENKRRRIAKFNPLKLREVVGRKDRNLRFKLVEFAS